MSGKDNFMEITEELSDFIRDTFDIDDDPDYNYDVNLFENGFVDSIDAIRIINFVENNWNIEITQKDLILFPMNSINEISEVVAGKVNL